MKHTSGYIEVFGTDQDGGERSFEVYYTLQDDGSLEVEGWPGIEECIYWEEDDIHSQIREEIQENYTDIETLEDLHNHTQVTPFGSGQFIIQDF